MKQLLISITKKYKKIFFILAVLGLPLIALGFEAPSPCDPEWRFFGWSSSNCGMDGGSQEVSHSHLPDNSGCVYYYEEVRYFFGFIVERRNRTDERECPD
ncbi:hypothetical protein G9H62_12565 [Aquirufa ecclesiirivi]|uniref:hypothetical protein n=1 Tax=Aquirufa ecclesiirivi TaxID=2715124 RepID=UPI0022A89CB1|nr:hypothetical protein [Aquirufa ecclesiirivi]MCZ2473682.1 hypothetical protein [Aquirufa ecclesiirivi]